MSYSSFTFPSSSLATSLSYASVLSSNLTSSGPLLKGLSVLVFMYSAPLYVTIAVI
jgi:hypothetical protein